jgi:prevent-host-death family protein
MDVGIRELKQRLSELLDRAAKGETIRVTDRGKPKALIGPVPGKRPVPDRIAQGIAEGWITPGNAEPPRFLEKRFKAKKTIQEMLDEDRGD